MTGSSMAGPETVTETVAMEAGATSCCSCTWQERERERICERARETQSDDEEIGGQGRRRSFAVVGRRRKSRELVGAAGWIWQERKMRRNWIGEDPDGDLVECGGG